MKICTKCGINKPLSEYAMDTRKKDGKYPSCTMCRNARQRQADYDRRNFINTLKNKPCMRCGITYPSYVMEFHHRDPDKKEFNLSKARSKPIDMIIKEVAKCDILCSNCHREVEHGDHRPH